MSAFRWPDGRRCAVSLSFDDARPSNTGIGLDILGEHGARATFFVLMSGVRRDEAGWRRAVAAGHELGNHSVLHPCSGNFRWSRAQALEDYDLARIEAELLQASADIEAFTGRRPDSYAYCCGQTFVGRGEGTRSYVPVVAKHFAVGRGFRQEYGNDPDFVDLAHIAGVDCDRATAQGMLAQVDQAAIDGSWVAFAGHDIGDRGRQSLEGRELDAFLRGLRDRPEVWLDTIGAVGAYVAANR